RGISARRMLVGLVIVLLAAAAIAGGFFWLGQRDPAVPGPPELIRAPEGPYKVKPQDPGGLDVTGESETAFETSAGQDVDSRLAVGDDGPPAVPEQAEPKAPPGETREPVRATEPAAPPASSGAPGSVIQLGAYKNTAQAERAWTALSSRFEALGSMTKMIVPYSAGGSSGYRLRAAASSPAQAKEACNALQAAGESCFIAR
ncbi:MAG: SPOR domain-containing protein, partial [Alphaproteobacteria bacterium]